MSFFSNFIKSLTQRVVYMNGPSARSKPYNPEIKTQEMCASILDCNATHIAKGRLMHVVVDENEQVKEIKRSSEYSKIFRRPNRWMSRQDLVYAIAWNLQVCNTAMAWIKWDARMHPAEVWPLVYMNFQIVEFQSGGYGVTFRDSEGEQQTVRVEDLAIIRRKYDGSGVSSEDNSAILDTLKLIQNLNESMTNAAETNNKIHGILEKKNTMLANTALSNNGEEFAQRMKAAANTGVLVLDGTENFTAVSDSAWAANAAQIKEVTERIYTYWRTPVEVVNNTANEQTMQNYLDSVVEPVWEEIGEAFTKALFTVREQDFGNRIVVYSGVATGASWQTKLNILKDTKDIGILSTNQQLELLGYPPVEGGDERLISLNYVNADNITEYQMGRIGSDKPKETENDKEENDVGDSDK